MNSTPIVDSPIYQSLNIHNNSTLPHPNLVSGQIHPLLDQGPLTPLCIKHSVKYTVGVSTNTHVHFTLSGWVTAGVNGDWIES